MLLKTQFNYMTRYMKDYKPYYSITCRYMGHYHALHVLLHASYIQDYMARYMLYYMALHLSLHKITCVLLKA